MLAVLQVLLTCLGIAACTGDTATSEQRLTQPRSRYERSSVAPCIYNSLPWINGVVLSLLRVWAQLQKTALLLGVSATTQPRFELGLRVKLGLREMKMIETQLVEVPAANQKTAKETSGVLTAGTFAAL